MSNQEDRFDFSDSENHGNQGERYRKSSEDKNDNGKADGINLSLIHISEPTRRS